MVEGERPLVRGIATFGGEIVILLAAKVHAAQPGEERREVDEHRLVLGP